MTFFKQDSSNILEMTDEHAAKQLIAIAESVHNSIKIQEDMLHKFQHDGHTAALLMQLASKKLTKRDLKELRTCIQDLEYYYVKVEEGKADEWNQLYRGAMSQLYTFFSAKKHDPREHFLRALGFSPRDEQKDQSEKEADLFEL